MNLNMWLVLIITSVLGPSISRAQTLAQHFTFDGVLTDSSGVPITTSSTIKFQITNMTGNCLLLEEQHTSVTPAADGSISIRIGSGTRTANDSGRSLAAVFSNRSQFPSNAGICPSPYTPAAGDGRLLKVEVNGVPLTGSIALSSVPTASVAETLQGRAPADFIQARDDASYDLSQSNIEDVFSTTNLPKLTALLSGDSSGLSAPTTSVGFNNQRLINVAAPTSATDAANKNYVDTINANVGGRTTDLAGVGAGVGNGNTLLWDAAMNRWTTGMPVASDATKLPLAGGTMTGILDMGNQRIDNPSHITMSPQAQLRFGQFSNSQESVAVGAMSGGTGGTVWFNTDSSQLKYWDGSAVQVVGSGGGGITGLTGDVIASGSGTVAATISNYSITTEKIATNPGVNRLVMTDATTGTSLIFKDCAVGEILRYSGGTGWTCSTETPAGDFTSDGSVAMTGPLRNVAGSASLPSFTFSADTDTGMFWPAADSIAFSIAGTERMRIAANGGVGIGTTAPLTGAILDLNGVGANFSSLIVPRDTMGNRPTSPVGGMLRYNTSTMEFEGYQNGAWKSFGASFPLESDMNGSPSSPAYSFLSNPTTGMYMPGANQLGLSTGGVERVKIDSMGNVGIGTSAPAARLHVSGAIVPGEVVIPGGSVADFANGNTVILQAVGGSAITLNNMVAGGQYTLIIEDTTSRTYTFSGCGTTYFYPANGTTTASSRTIYEIKNVQNTRCYIKWSSGYM